MNIEIANRLLQYRKKHNLSQEELAEKIGVSRQAVSKWERAEASPDTDNLIILAQIYGVTLDELLQGKSEPDSREQNPVPDPDATYIPMEDKVSFKNGIHVDTKDGTHVHIDSNGIHVEESGKTRAYTDEDGNVYVDEEFREMHNHCHKKNPAHLFPMWLIALIGFLVWGFSGVLCGWALSWICFLAIPLYHTLVTAIIKKNPSIFAYPVLCVAVYMILGFFMPWGWRLGWMVFLTIPLYYWAVEMCRALTSKKNETVVDTTAEEVE